MSALLLLFPLGLMLLIRRSVVVIINLVLVKESIMVIAIMVVVIVAVVAEAKRSVLIDSCWKLHGKPAWANQATVYGDYFSPLFEEQVLITKTEYDSFLQRANAPSSSKNGYRCYSPTLWKHFVSVDVKVFEDIPYYSPKGGQLQESIPPSLVIPTHAPPVSQVYVRRRNQAVTLIPPPIESTLLLPPSASSSADPPLPLFTSDLDIPIVIRKSKRTCTDRPISNFVSFDHLSLPFQAFSLSISSIVIPKSYKEALSHPGWRKAMEEEMFESKREYVCQLKKSIYGLKQSPCPGFDKFSKAIVSHGCGLLYRSSGHLCIEGYTNTNCAGSPPDLKSTTGYCTFIGGNLVTWRSKKQSVVARSSAETEYRAAVIHIASNPIFHKRTKHIEVDCHFIRSKVESKDIVTPFVLYGSQLADIFTKALPKNAIDSICTKLGVIDIYSLA
uniref:Reverse transcriptase Ty1/copia-type domain-containing protein n=1 Tax=Fagus sylvatica TaxID=28930 RepID=A0A2N9J0E2_FAGSY